MHERVDEERVEDEEKDEGDEGEDGDVPPRVAQLVATGAGELSVLAARTVGALHDLQLEEPRHGVGLAKQGCQQ